MLTSTLEVMQKHASHPHKNDPSLWHDSSYSSCKKIWAMQKKSISMPISMGKKKKKKKKKDSPYPKIKDGVMQKGVRVPSRKNSLHMHILIWLYDLFSPLDPVFDFAKYVVQVCFLFIPYPELHQKALLEEGRGKRRTNALVRNHTHWAIWESHLRSKILFWF